MTLIRSFSILCQQVVRGCFESKLLVDVGTRTHVRLAPAHQRAVHSSASPQYLYADNHFHLQSVAALHLQWYILSQSLLRHLLAENSLQPHYLTFQN